ncbi:MAG: hypothetical protein OXC48_12225, partial [Endozoicomonadaceae bacterium]|nr:hypothetical protein [Endozoicomonadaceae bacterium]
MLQLEKKITTIIALRVTIASLLSILIAYGLGWTQPTDLAFFAPCSVCANILMFPFQSRRNNMMTERLIGSGVGYLIAIAYVQSFPDYPSWGLIYSGILSFSCCYIVGCNVQYTHAYVQVLLIMNVVLTFNYILPDMVVKTWQLPICNLIALATIYFVDIIFYHGQIKKILLSYKNTLFNHFLLQLRQNNAASSAISVYEKHETFLKNFKMHISHGEKQRLNFINGQIKRINNSILLIHQQIKKFPVFSNWLTTDFVVIKQQIAKAIECIKGEKNFDFQETEMFISRFKQRTQQISNKTNLMHIYKLVYELTAILSAMKKIQHLENNKIDDEKQNQEPLLFTSLTLYTVKFSLKTTLSVIITVLLLEQLYIPGLLQAVIASILVSLTPNVNELFYRILMYLAGIIFGGAIALVVGELCFRLDSMVLLFVLCIVVIFFIARLGLIYKQYDYAAIQASVT